MPTTNTLLELCHRINSLNGGLNGALELLSSPVNHVDITGAKDWQISLLSRGIDELDEDLNAFGKSEIEKRTRVLIRLARNLPEIEVTSQTAQLLTQSWPMSDIVTKFHPSTWEIPGFLESFVVNGDTGVMDENYWADELSLTARMAPTASNDHAEDIALLRMCSLPDRWFRNFLRSLMIEVTGSYAITEDSCRQVAATMRGFPLVRWDSLEGFAVDHVLGLAVNAGVNPTALLPMLNLALGTRDVYNPMIIHRVIQEWIAEPDTPLEWFIALHGEWDQPD